MKPIIEQIDRELDPGLMVEQFRGRHPILLSSTLRGGFQGRYTLLAADPCLRFEAHGAQCQWWDVSNGTCFEQFGNPWAQLFERLERFEMADGPDLPFPTGGVFGYWGYDLKSFTEPRVGRRAVNDLELPDCAVGFYPSLMVWDHELDRIWVVATGLDENGDAKLSRAREQIHRWNRDIANAHSNRSRPVRDAVSGLGENASPESSLNRGEFESAVRRALDYIRAGDIYQVNLARRLSLPYAGSGRQLFSQLSRHSPAPFAALMEQEDFSVISSSPELFLKISGDRILTRPIKGTRPRSRDPDEDARLAFELQASEKERAELLMITDLLRNDLGRISEFGSVTVPDLMKLERFAQVHHLVSTVSGQLRPGLSHLEALAACFPGGSITGAPKIRAMQIIDELEPVSRGPYTGCMGYLGFNRESQLSILIRTAILKNNRAWYHTGAGIVADSIPEMEYRETEVKARGFLQSLQLHADPKPPLPHP